MKFVCVITLFVEIGSPFGVDRMYSSKGNVLRLNSVAPWSPSERRQIEKRKGEGRNRRERRFDELLEALSYSDEETLKIQDSRLAIILQGAGAVNADEKVRRAFEILYCDIAPIRLAGELIFRQLNKAVTKATANEAREGTQTALAFGIDASEMLAAQQVFDAIDADRSGTLDRDELLRFNLLKSVGQCDNCSCRGVKTCQALDRFMLELDADGDGEISLLDFMLNAGRTIYGTNTYGFEQMESQVLRPKSANADKFDAMVQEFQLWAEWRDAYTQNQQQAIDQSKEKLSRLDAVLDGCFSGAQNKRVVAALRVVFEDYDSLRTCADLIFKLMRATAKKAPWYDYEN